MLLSTADDGSVHLREGIFGIRSYGGGDIAPLDCRNAIYEDLPLNPKNKKFRRSGTGYDLVGVPVIKSAWSRIGVSSTSEKMYSCETIGKCYIFGPPSTESDRLCQIGTIGTDCEGIQSLVGARVAPLKAIPAV